MTIPEIEQHLDNWRNYYKDRYAQRVTPSLEGRYKGELGDVLEQDLPAPSKPVDVKQALKMEKLVVGLPMPHKLILVTEIMYKQAPNYALSGKRFYLFCRLAAIKPRDFDDLLRKAKLMIGNKL